jgi:hypothetical protein
VAGSHDGKTIHLGTPTPNPVHFEQNGDVYFIHSADGWDVFCDALQDNTTYNRFSGKTVKLAPSSGNSISVTRMAGSSQHDFCGTFDGQGKTLDFNYTTSTDDAAPFRYVDGGRIENLRVTGTITTSAKNAAGIIAHQYGSTTISNCRSNVTISSSISGDGTHGGLVAVTGGGSTVSFEGCVFDGSLLGTSTRCWGGFVGWRSSSNGTVNVSNSIFNPASVTGNADDSYAFVRRGDNTKVNITNSYYTTALGLLGLNVELTNYNAQGQEIWQEDISFGDDW